VLIVRINLLSEVAAYGDGGNTNLLGGLQPMYRLFVAALALTAGRPAGMDRLEEQLWSGFPPAEPRARLHSCASKVRLVLKNAGIDGDLLVAQAGGYCLRVDGPSVDVHRFRAKAAEARTYAAEARGGDDGVVALAREALSEWGPGPTQLYGPEPLAGLPGEWAANYRLTLRREHRDVLVELLAAELRRGGAKRALAEFASLADADEAAWEDEQLAGLLMHAYYLCGRKYEALKVYQRTIESLRQNGVEAGRELRMLEKKIRNQDPSLDYPGAGTAPRDLVPADEGYDDDGSAPSSGAQGRADPGSGPANNVNRAPSYSQQNIGRTVVANQGTQHVNLGGSDE
jgi:DNA-binding SARP family transcriptional activator